LLLLALGWLLLRTLGARVRQKLVKAELEIESLYLKKSTKEDIKEKLPEKDIKQNILKEETAEEVLEKA